MGPVILCDSIFSGFFSGGAGGGRLLPVAAKKGKTTRPLSDFRGHALSPLGGVLRGEAGAAPPTRGLLPHDGDAVERPHGALHRRE